MVFTHAFAGAIVANLIVRKKSLPNKQKSIVYALGIIGGVFPDFDLTLVLFNLAETHRNLISHSFVPYTLALALWMLIVGKNERFKFYGLVFYVGVLSHLFLDMLAGGLVALSPFTNNIYGIILPATSTSIEWARMYFGSIKHMSIEASIVIAYLISIKKEKDRVARQLPWVFFAVAVATVLTLLFI